MPRKLLRQLFFSFRGLDYSRDSLTKEIDFLHSAQNSSRSISGAEEQRPGCKVSSEVAGPEGWEGIHNNVYLDATTGATAQELVCISGGTGTYPQVHRYTDATLTITYSGGGTLATSSFYPDGLGNWSFGLKVDGIAVSGFPVGVSPGLEIAATTLSSLVALINAAPDFSATASVTANLDGISIPAATLPIMVDYDLSLGPIRYKYWLEIPGEITNATQDHSAPGFTDPSFADLNDVVYISVSGHNNPIELYKYDGVSTFRAGLPRAGIDSFTDTGSGSNKVNGEYYQYLVYFKRIDNRGNIVYSLESDTYSYLATSVSSIQLVLRTVSENVADTRGAIVDGAQTVTAGNPITVDSGHTLVVGNTAYYYDTGLSAYATALVTATTATTITLDTDAAVADNAVISDNTRIVIYRTQNSGSTFFLLDELPNDPFNDPDASTYVYIDSKVVGDVGDRYIPPFISRDAPPRCSLVAAHQGLLVLSGNTDEPNTVFWSDIESPEYFPATNSIDIAFTSQGPISAIVSLDNELIVFKARSYAIIRGDLLSNAISVSIFDKGVGCPSHKSIAETSVGLIWLSERGFERMVGGVIDELFHLRLQRLFQGQFFDKVIGTTISTEDEPKFLINRAQGIYDYRKNRFLCYVPAVSGTWGTINSILPNEHSRVFSYDERHDRWDVWVYPTSINARCGYAIHKGELYFSSKHLKGALSAGGSLFKVHSRGDQYDAADNTEAVNWFFSPQWDNGGLPSVFKKFLRIRTWRTDTARASPFTVNIDTYRDFSNTTPHSSIVQDYSSPTKLSERTKLAGGRAQSLRFRFSNSLIHQSPSLSGYEYELVIPQEEEIRS